MKKTYEERVVFNDISMPQEFGTGYGVSDSGVYSSAGESYAPSGKGRTAAKKRKKAISVPRVFYIALGAFLIYLVCMGLLFQHSRITELNEEIRTTQTQLEEIQGTNDSKSGQIVSNRDLTAIEAAARSYGMTEPSADQFVYEDSLNTTGTALGDKGLSDYLNTSSK